MIQVVTDLGIQALANAMSDSTEITFTKYAVGSGTFDPETQDAREMTALITQAAIVSVSSVRKDTTGVAVYGDFDNTIISGGTSLREIGVFAKLNDGDEFLFAYGYTTTPEVVPSSSVETYERRFISHFVITDEEQELVVSYASITPEDIGAADRVHTHSATDVVSGTLPVNRGGTGRSSTAKGAMYASADDGALQMGTLPVDLGGTGQTTAAGERNRLGLGNTTDALPVANGGTGRTSTAKGAMYASADDGALQMGTLPVDLGGTGQTTAAGERNRLGLGNTTDALPVANGGTGKTTAAKARASLGSIPMATSSTGATTAAKEATLADFALYAGARVPVQFTNANTLEAALTLNINSTGVKDIYVGGSATSASNPATWSAGAICEFVYDGTCWHYLGSNIDGYEDAAAGQAVTDLASDIASLRDSVDLLPTYAVELNKGNGVVNATIGHYNEELSLLVELTSGKQLMFTMKKSGLGFYDRDNSQSSWTLRKAW